MNNLSYNTRNSGYSSFFEGSYRYGFGSHERDDEAKGKGNHYSFGDHGYDPRGARRWNVDPESVLLPHISPYSILLNSPLRVVDVDGQFPIIINGKTLDDEERGSTKYWQTSTLEVIEKQTGYKLGNSNKGSNNRVSQFSGDFYFVDGNQGTWPSERFGAGMVQACLDADDIWGKMKETMKDGKITEQLQVISHSRGSAFAEGYMESLREQIKMKAKAEGIGFAYSEDAIIEYSVNLAPHQSNYINYPTTGTKNVNISHIGDPLSGNDATGDVINIHSVPDKELGPIGQHAVGSFNRELKFVLNLLENNKNKADLKQTLSKWYGYYDNNRTNGGTSKVE